MKFMKSMKSMKSMILTHHRQAARQDAALAVQAEEQEAGALESQVAHQQSQVARKTKTARDLERFADQARWCERMLRVAAALGGVELRGMDDAQGVLQLRLTIAVPLHFVPAGSVASTVGVCQGLAAAH